MARALALARRAEGRTHPNPPVGAVVLRGGRILGGGSTRPAGGPHAEAVALAAVRRRFGERALRGATLATTLEPCCHHGRTGPCTQAIIEAGMARVWIGHLDPNPAVRGRGVRLLRRAGIAVEVGICEARCRRQHRGFLSVQQRGRPWLALKLAASLDGRIATRSGESRWITGAAARALVHRLRARHDAVMIGSGTARADDPQLTARPGGRRLRAPVRIVVDSQLATPPGARLLCDGDAARTWLLTRRGHSARRRAARSAHGARLVEAPLRAGRLDLRRALGRLAALGLTSVLVEGGGGLAAALLRQGLADELHWFAAPALLGADARPAIGPLALRRLRERRRLCVQEVRRLGADLYLRAELHPPEAAPGAVKAALKLASIRRAAKPGGEK
ncbi:MAG: bifunctional diaminohydroxyphosphoribosylaminopyrimidine deaminase/5-amino-6-(5-phosphoribosylamino)uracil reductase RibD [Deltaproteobacteria bacterium]|nr:bifunctional diaminohydroxyphosphoribosylaminopyrimidine deaminase/5-amino-6-(5-phosphoribosylamino)uracil reductase RibD [Deltaproteobacteria bacterium]